jgi:glycosyltransferase involved in cell wall biosynthesis
MCLTAPVDNRRPQVSVIIPVYNASPYMERCARSLFEQELEDMEFIFVDDCSSDNSIAIVKSLLHNSYPERVKQTQIVRHDKNRGVAAARNTGLDNATGDYIGWVDPDDWVEPEMFEQLYALVEKYDSDIVWCDMYIVYGRQKYLQSMRSVENNLAVIKDLLLGKRHSSLCVRIIRKELYFHNGIRFLEGSDTMEDKNVLVRLMVFARNIKYIPCPLYYYEKSNPTSHTASWNDLDVPRAAIENLNAIIQFLNNTNLREKLFMDMKYAKLILKKGLLNSSNLQAFKIWKDLFAEENKHVLSCPNMTLRQRILGWSIEHDWWIISKMWICVKRNLAHQERR